MKKIVLKSLLIVCSIIVGTDLSKAQFVINGLNDINFACIEGDKITEDDYDALKKCTVYYISSANEEDRDSLETVLNTYWTYTKLKVISPEEHEKAAKEKNAAFLLTSITYSDYSVKTLELCLLRFKNPKDENSKVTYAKIPLTFDCEYQKIYEKEKIEGLLQHVTNGQDVNNLKSGVFASFLVTIQTHLESMKGIDCNETIMEKEKLSVLKDETLYITSDVLTRGYCSTAKWDKKELLAKYPFKYKLISFEELNEKILSDEEFYYMIAYRMGARSVSLNLYDNKNKECLYYEFFSGHEFKPSRFDRLSKLISK